MKTVHHFGRILFTLAVSVMPWTANAQGTVKISRTELYRFSTLWLGESKSLAVDAQDSKSIRLVDRDISLTQYWYVNEQPNGYYTIINGQFILGVVDIVNDGTQNNRLTLSSFNNYSGQFWKLTPNQDGSYFRITSLWQGDGKSLDVVNDGNNRELILNSTGDYSGQFWKLTLVTEEEKRLQRERYNAEYVAQQAAIAAQQEQQRIQEQTRLENQRRYDEQQRLLAQQRLEEQNRQQAATIIAQQQALQQTQRQKQYTVGIDCKGYSTLTKTETNDIITVTFVDINGFDVGSQSKQINNCDADTYLTIAGTNIVAIHISTSGSDGFWMDRVWMLEDGNEIARWGKNEGDGYCLSRDPADANGGFKNFIGSRGCKDCMRFDVTSQQVVECRNLKLHGR
ncbi:MAG: RICIN domain-containing protein [Flammeovirgaceae bacterium]|jgi:hypothetical protein|nr:RICIN domain-containing protein [Flammeovirgaceae bacterium]